MEILHVSTGPCEAQATFMCTGIGVVRLNPMAMLPETRIPNAYVPICQLCYEHLADRYVSLVHVPTPAPAHHLSDCWGFDDGWACEPDCPIAVAHFTRVRAES
jgi:hypothetical protein